MDEDMLKLGGSIVLTGFKNIDLDSMVILKKIIGTYARKLSDKSTGFSKLSLTMKNVHSTEASSKFELHAKIEDSGDIYTSSVVDRNLFVAVDTALKKVECGLIGK